MPANSASRFGSALPPTHLVRWSGVQLGVVVALAHTGSMTGRAPTNKQHWHDRTVRVPRSTTLPTPPPHFHLSHCIRSRKSLWSRRLGLDLHRMDAVHVFFSPCPIHRVCLRCPHRVRHCWGAERSHPEMAVGPRPRRRRGSKELAMAGSGREPGSTRSVHHDPAAAEDGPGPRNPRPRRRTTSSSPSNRTAGIVPASGTFSRLKTHWSWPTPANGWRPGPSPTSTRFKRIHHRAAEQFAKLEGFECRLTRRETVNGKPMPEEVLEYRFRKEPLQRAHQVDRPGRPAAAS